MARMSIKTIGTASQPLRHLGATQLISGAMFLIAAILLAGDGGLWGQGGVTQERAFAALTSAFCATCGLALLAPRGLSAGAALFDFSVVFIFASLARANISLWRAPDAWSDLFALTPIGVSCAVALYTFGLVIFASTSGRRPDLRGALALALAPPTFCLFIALGSELPAKFVYHVLGRTPQINFVALSAGRLQEVDYAAFVGRSLLLSLLNIGLVISAAIALGRSTPRSLALYGVLVVAAIFASATPLIAALGSSIDVAALPTPLKLSALALSAGLAQAGLWGETYLVTQAIVDLLYARPPLVTTIKRPWTLGLAKGFVYGLVFLGVIASAGVAVHSEFFVRQARDLGLSGIIVFGIGVYPLARTILESTDSTPPFFRRLWRECHRVENYLRGAILGVALIYVFYWDELTWSGAERFAFGFVAGAAIYAGADALSDFAGVLARRRRYFSDWRLSVFGIMLGGVTGGAIAWYFDATQLSVVSEKLTAYVTINNAQADRKVVDFTIFPLFSKWGMTNLGPVQGGVKLFYLESLSGVIQWIFAAPLFSINLFFLTAIIKRDLKPLRVLFSAQGARTLVENAISVLRWGLWMAPIIYTFLKAVGEPTWYNQDGLIRTGAAAVMAATSSPQNFTDWSLGVFTGLLAFDWLRILIWFDHMGLRVSTLVNLSFVGGDALDERAARFLGKAQVSRAIPEGLRRFGTWAPLLLPFYIPRGKDWTVAWSAAEKMRATPAPALDLTFGYVVAGGGAALALAMLVLRKLAREGHRDPKGKTGSAGDLNARPLILTNGLITSEWYEDGQSYSRIENAARKGPPIDLTRRPDDPAQPRGKFLYVRVDNGALRSLGAAPVFAADSFGALRRVSPTQLFLTRVFDDIRIEAEIALVENLAAETIRVRLTNLSDRPRVVQLCSLREWVINEGGVEKRDAAYNALHITSWFDAGAQALFAQNRLLKDQKRKTAARRMSHELAVHAAHVREGEVELLGYEDMKSRFFGMGDVGAPQSLVRAVSMRALEDEGYLVPFEPCAALCYEARLRPHAEIAIDFVDGWAKNDISAYDLISSSLGVQGLSNRLNELTERKRILAPAPARSPDRCEFSLDGGVVMAAPGAPRPLTHVLANTAGQGAVVTADGDIFSFSGNARQNALTPFRMGEGRWGPPGQSLFVRDLATNEIFSPTYSPLVQEEGSYGVEFGLGYVRFMRYLAEVETKLELFMAPGRRAQIKLLKLRNLSPQAKSFSVTSIDEIALGETMEDSLGRLKTCATPGRTVLLYSNPSNFFVKGWAFATTSLDLEFAEFDRRRAFGPPGRKTPYLAATGHPDFESDPDARKVAAFSGIVHIPAGETREVVLALGQCDDLETAQRLAHEAADPARAALWLTETRENWRRRLSRLRIKTNRPDFDRLVNDWLPYQLLAARLWGRTGPSQRSGATGYRDQLQDVLPLAALAPDLARAQILAHAERQFLDGDAVKWWHTAPNGGTGLADRTHSSDPHLWLPYVAMRYVEASGDARIFDEITPFIEGDSVPAGQEGAANVPLPSRERASLFEHCARAIDWSLQRMGHHGLPLMGSGDWDDGMNLVGFEGKGESVWVGFFLFGILTDFAIWCDRRAEGARATRYMESAARLKSALENCWRGDRFLRAYADDGTELNPMSAMTASWPILSGAVDFSRGLQCIDQAMGVLARPDRILLVYPAYDENSKPFPGRSAEYPIGVRENGGQYSHGVSWLVDGLARLAEQAEAAVESSSSSELHALALNAWVAISPLSKYSDPIKADIYGLPPHQQPADVYEGPGYEGRGGWAWYTGSAARMISAAYAMLGIQFKNGELALRSHAFTPKGDLSLESVTWDGRTFDRPHVA